MDPVNVRSRLAILVVAAALVMSLPACTDRPSPTCAAGRIDADGTDRSVSPGMLLFTAARSNDYLIHSVNSNGSGLTSLGTGLRHAQDPAWSPDAKQIAFVGCATDCDYTQIYVMGADGAHLRQLTSVPDVGDSDPAWSPDGTKIVFSRLLGDGHSRLFVVDVASQQVTQLTDDDTYQDTDPDWSSDGRQIAFMRNADSYPSIFVIDADGSSMRRLTNTRLAADTAPAWSPDSKQLVFTRDEDQEGNYNLCVMNADGAAVRLLVVGGYDYSILPPEPVWSADGEDIAFFRNRTLYAIRPDGSGEITLLKVRGAEKLPHAVRGGIDWAAP